MACACQGRGRNATYVWISPDDPETTITYSTEIQAKAKVIRNGGSYVKQA